MRINWRNKKGFTLIELLIVVAIIGIIAAIAIPNLLNAIQRGKQKRTMSDLRSIGTAVESYQVDNGYPCKTANGATTTLSDVLSPTFIKSVPDKDGWKNSMTWNQNGQSNYSVYSFGKNGSADLQAGATTNFSSDIYFSDGQFSAFPEGTQN